MADANSAHLEVGVDTRTSTAADDRLVLDHLELAEAVARRFCGAMRGRDDDLVQVAYIGLLNAARRFDPARGRPFPAFAVPTITGELKRHLRDHGWFIRPPRSVQELSARVAEAIPRLAQRLGRPASVAELTTELDSSSELVREALDSLQHRQPASLDISVGAGESTLADLVSDGGAPLERAEIAAMLWSASRALSPRERRIVHLRFFEDHTQQDIAQEIGVTQMQISRILTKALRILRDRLVNGTPGAAGEQSA